MSGIGGAAGAVAYMNTQQQKAYKRGFEAAKSGERKVDCPEQARMEKEYWEKGYNDFVAGHRKLHSEKENKPMSRWKLAVNTVLVVACLILLSWAGSFSS